MGEVWSNFTERECRVCGRKYHVPLPSDWGWMCGQETVCSYSCMRKAERRKAASRRTPWADILKALARERKNGKNESER